MARGREFLKNLVASRIDEVIPVGDVVQGQTAIETPIDAIEEELDFSAEFVTRVGNIEQLFPALVSDLKYFHDHNTLTRRFYKICVYKIEFIKKRSNRTIKFTGSSV